MAGDGSGHLPCPEDDPEGSRTSMPPLLLHFDVNKTIIISDMIMNKSNEYSIREVIASQFWGRLDRGDDPEKLTWTWLGKGPSVDAPILAEGECMNYLRFCRKTHQDKTLSMLATRSFDLVGNAVCKQQMIDISDQVVAMMSIPAKLRTPDLKQHCGLPGEWRLIFPSFFRLVASLQRSGQRFTVCFRSFGTDLPRIQVEWNAFCNMQHPLYNHYLDGIGPMNGTVDGIPDRRLREDDVHTMYRDEEGPCLALNVMTNGSYEGEWDQWSRSHPSEDTRQGRSFFQENGISTVQGFVELQTWFKKQLDLSRSQLVKDDYAWWHRCGEVTCSGKLLIGIPGIHQVFFDDNIDLDGLRIVDPRFSQTFEPVPAMKAIGKACLRVDPLLAMLEEDYLLNVFKEAARNVDPHGCSVLCDVFQAKVGDVVKILNDTQNYGKLATVIDPCWHGLVKVEMKEQQADPRAQLKAFPQADVTKELDDSVSLNPTWQGKGESRVQPEGFLQAPELHDAAPPMEDVLYEPEEVHGRIEVASLEKLTEILTEAGIDMSQFGDDRSTYKTVETLYEELVQGKCYLTRSDHAYEKDSQCEGEDEFHRPDAESDLLRVMEVVRVKLMCNHLILCESHEQLPDGRLRSRNGFLPATKKRAGESLSEAIGRWGVEELQLKLTDVQKCDAVQSVEHTHDVQPESMSYPLPVSTHYFEVTVFLDPDDMDPIQLQRLGLPAGSMFSTTGMKKVKKGSKNSSVEKAGSRSFWSWYGINVWEAMQETQEVELPDIHQNMAQLFKGDPRQQGYQQLLMQMFDSFDASKLCGGMSGSLVLQVTPVDPIYGKKMETCIVKLDKAQVVSREIVYSKRVCNVLSDRAARILGDGCFVTDDAADEYGAFKLELAGGCWQVPELSGGTLTKDLLSTFKDLLIVHSMRMLLNEELIQGHLLQVHGDVEAVLRELLGPGGMLRVLRREGLSRNTQNLFKSFFFVGKDTRWNPLFQPGHFQLEPMQKMWRRTFGKLGTPELPDVRKQVQDLSALFAQLEEAMAPMSRYMPVIGLAHGDLNAMNILIDVMDAVWLIDFAFSEEKPICWDLAKLEIAFMFEYAVLPVSWQTLLEFAGETEEDWQARKVPAWLKVGESTTYAILRELKKLRDTPVSNEAERSQKLRKKKSRLSTSCHQLKNDQEMEAYESLGKAIQGACDFAWPEPLSKADQKKKDSERLRLHALLLSSQEQEEVAMLCAQAIADCMMAGDDLNCVLDPPALPDAAKAPDGASLVWCWAKCNRLRMFLKEEWETLQGVLRREGTTQHKADESPLVFWLGLLQESHRLLGYFDVAPWVKVWAIYYIETLVAKINHHSNPPDAMEPVLVCTHKQKRSSARQDQIRECLRHYPTSSEVKLQTTVLNGSTQGRIAQEVRREVRIAHAEGGARLTKGGYFVKVVDVKSVTKSDAEVPFKMVDHDLGSSAVVSFGIDCFKEIGSLEMVGGSALVKMTSWVVPLSDDELGVIGGVMEVHSHVEGEDFLIELNVAQEAVFCYPPGARVRIADPNVATQLPVGKSGRLRHGTILELNESSGNYRIRWDGEESVSATEVDPDEGNHVSTKTCCCEEGEKLIVFQEPDRFVEAVVLKRKEASMWEARHLMRAVKQGTTADWWVDLNDFNHCRVLGDFGGPEFEAELQRYRVSLKAKHSLIWTVTSERADCLEGPVPRVAGVEGKEMPFWGQVQDLLCQDDERLASQTLVKGWLIVGQPGSGKSCVLCKIVMQCLGSSRFLIPLLIPVVDLVGRLDDLASRLDKCEASDPRLMSNTSRSYGDLATDDGESLIDWYIRACFGDDSQRYFMLMQALQCHRLLLLFDGLDEAGRHLPRLQRCLQTLVALDHRVVATARISQKLQELSGKDLSIFQKPQRSLLTWVHSDACLFNTVELLPFDREDHSDMIGTLLKREAEITPDEIGKCEKFIKGFMDTLDDSEQECRMWNTPLMFAMLVASWRERRREKKSEAATKTVRRTLTTSSRNSFAVHQQMSSRPSFSAQDTGVMSSRASLAVHPSMTPRMSVTSQASDGISMRRVSSLNTAVASKFDLDHDVNIHSIYSVALDLLLRRVQSRSQADRHKLKKSLAESKSILEIIATHMMQQSIEAFTEDDLLPLLQENMISEEVWNELSEAIQQGRVPLLVAEGDGENLGGTRFLFAYKSFQHFLARDIASPDSSPNASRRPSALPLPRHTLTVSDATNINTHRATLKTLTSGSQAAGKNHARVSISESAPCTQAPKVPPLISAPNGSAESKAVAALPREGRSSPDKLPPLSNTTAERRGSWPVEEAPPEKTSSNASSRTASRHNTAPGISFSPQPPTSMRTGTEAPRRHMVGIATDNVA